AQKSGKQPFFCWAHFYDPHAPYEPPEPFATRYSSSLYDGEIAYVDKVTGEILDSLKRQGLFERTVIIVTSDHGESLGEHVEKTHGYFIYESTQLVPLIWKSPGERYQPGHTAGTVRLIDIAPTVLQQLGIRAPAVMQGTGLVRELLGRPGPALQAYAESYYPRLQFGWSELRSLYRFPYKYIEAPQPELYDLETDPNEKLNLIESRRSIANSLRDQLMELIERYSPSTELEQEEIDAETAAALASLGYVTLSAGTSVDDDSYQDLPDPKDKVSIYVETTETYSLIRKGKYPEAIRSFEKILREDPTATFVYHSMGTTYSKMGRDKEAVDAFLKAAKTFPSDATLFFNMGSSYLRLADWENAEKCLDKAIELDPTHFRARGNLASLWLQQGRFEEALEASLEILQKHPNYEVGLFDAGVASAALGKAKAAIEYLEKARQVNPQNPRTYQYLSQLYDAAGEPEKAQEYLSKAKELGVKPR
ncbi:MAG TPA: tetratricopeptide repeat protein, partial [Acidobacteriota bacterium]|nr:tetratricopeptide repeat protein [Acidobacteriota bacterium]